MSVKGHWETVYSEKSDSEVSWTQSDVDLSLSLINEVCASGSIIDVGGGTSILVDRLVDQRYSIAVLDIAEAALARARNRLADRASLVRWIAADVTTHCDLGTFDLWHDRAVFHFLTEPADQAAYVTMLSRSVRPGGHAIIATFAMDGPEKCSGLPVKRYDGPALANQLGAAFDLVKTIHETHVTPWGKPQSFQFSLFHRR